MLKEIATEEEYQQLLAQGVIPIDVRSHAEIEEGKIPQAAVGYDWNSGEFHDNFDQLDPEKAYLFICRSGNRSMQACLFLQSQGFDKVYNLKGGMMNWQGAVE
ncbi:MAG: rhodanese-like domain-containing protein [Chitinophagales bacterium]|nr:rhodanese-like domain-containing protein [Chitinophagales bacterium]